MTPQPVLRENRFVHEVDLGQVCLAEGDQVQLTLTAPNAARTITLENLPVGYHVIEQKVGEVLFRMHLGVI